MSPAFCSIRSLATRAVLPRLLSVTPSSSLVDSKVAIRATGMKPNSPVTIRSLLNQKTESGEMKVEGHAQYIADARGVVSVPDQVSLGGTYTGMEPMGLFWSMCSSPDQRFGTRFLFRDASVPMKVNLSVYRGHLDTEALQTAEPEATATAERLYMGNDVEKITVHDGRLRGTLFKPKGPGPFPGVIDMFGSAGGLIEIRAAMLASHGFACYALPYFGYDDLPPTVWELNLEYFQEAVDWITKQPFVKPGGIGMVGVSFGQQIAMALVTRFPEKIKAVVSINGFHVQCTFSLTLNGVLLPYKEYDVKGISPSQRTKDAVEMSPGYESIYDLGQEDDCVYKLENAPDCQFMFIAGEDDRLWDSPYNAQEATRRLARHGCHNYQLLTYPNAGHLIEVPYAPSTGVAYSKFIGSVVENGGTVLGNAKAMEDSWPKIIHFLHATCGRDKSKL